MSASRRKRRQGQQSIVNTAGMSGAEVMLRRGLANPNSAPANGQVFVGDAGLVKWLERVGTARSAWEERLLKRVKAKLKGEQEEAQNDE